MSGTGAFGFGAPLKATGATTSPAPPNTSIFNMKTTPSLVSDSGFSQPNSARLPASTPQSLFSFGVAPSSAIIQEGSSISQPPVSFGRPSPASPAPQSFFGFGQRKSASPAPQSPFGFGQPTPASSTPQPTTPITEVALTPGLFSGNDFPSNPEASVDAGTAKRKCDEEAAGAPEDLRSAQLKLWHDKKHTDLIVNCSGGTWQCHKATLLPRCPAFEEACVVSASGLTVQQDGKHELKLADQKAEVVEALLIYLYTYELPKFATAGDASIALHLGNLYSITKFAEIARSQILEALQQKLDSEEKSTSSQASIQQPLFNHTGSPFGGPYHSSRTSPPGLFGNSPGDGKF